MIAALAAFAALAAAVTPEPPAASPALTVYSHNLRVDRLGEGWARRNGPIVQALGDRYSLALFQEVTEAQAPALYKALPGYNAVFGERSDGHRGQGFYEYNPIFYRADQFRLVRASSFWVSEDPTAPGATLAGTKRHGRVVTWIRLQDWTTHRELLVVNLHIHGERARDAVELVTRHLEGETVGAALLLAGDFNVRPDHPAVAWLEGQGLHDARASARRITGPEETVIRAGQFTYDSTGVFSVQADDRQRLDYVFGCGLARPDSYAVLPLPLPEPNAYASDHYAVTVSYPAPMVACRD